MHFKGREQLSLSRLIEVTVDDFDHSLKAWKFSLLALHSRVDPGHLAKLLVKSRGLPILDERRRLNSVDQRKRDYLDDLVEASCDYSAWVCDREFQPLLRDLLVSQCVGFENFLKTIGVASRLSSSVENLGRLIFVPSDEFRQAHKAVNKSWKELAAEGRTRQFLEQFVVSNKVFRSEYSGWNRVNLEHQSPIWDEVFRLRNAVVHSRARPGEQIEIGKEIFSPFDEAVITEHTLRSLDGAFRVVVDAFRLCLEDL